MYVAEYDERSDISDWARDRFGHRFCSCRSDGYGDGYDGCGFRYLGRGDVVHG